MDPEETTDRAAALGIELAIANAIDVGRVRILELGKLAAIPQRSGFRVEGLGLRV